MIYSIYVIEVSQPSVPLVQHTFKKLKLNHGHRPRNGVYREFFETIERVIGEIQESQSRNQNINEFTRILVHEDLNIIIYYCGLGDFLVCSINDLDDDKEKILDSLEAISRRFYQKHRTNIQEFRYSNQTRVFHSFVIDVKNLTVNGIIGEEYPTLIVNQTTLDRLKRMSIIDDKEYKIAQSCKGKNSPFKISQMVDTNYETIKEVLTKLRNLDIIEQQNLAFSKFGVS